MAPLPGTDRFRRTHPLLSPRRTAARTATVAGECVASPVEEELVATFGRGSWAAPCSATDLHTDLEPGIRERGWFMESRIRSVGAWHKIEIRSVRTAHATWREPLVSPQTCTRTLN